MLKQVKIDKNVFLHFFFKFVNGILRNCESLCDVRPDCHHHFDASRTSNAMFDELAERSLMSPLEGTKHTYVRLAIIISHNNNYCLLSKMWQTLKCDTICKKVLKTYNGKE